MCQGHSSSYPPVWEQTPKQHSHQPLQSALIIYTWLVKSDTHGMTPEGFLPGSSRWSNGRAGTTDRAGWPCLWPDECGTARCGCEKQTPPRAEPERSDRSGAYQGRTFPGCCSPSPCCPVSPPPPSFRDKTPPKTPPDLLVMLQSAP